jgi:DNA-binding SARP family transcriptional activator/tetratricopeptide (TPR) repeat protein
VSIGIDGGPERGVQVHLLGPVEVVRRGQRLDLGRRRERLLLGLLMLEPGRVVSVHRLIELLWDVDAPPSARASLRTHVARLRTSLAACDITLAGRTDGYLAEVEPDLIDAHRFVEQVAAARGLVAPDMRAAALRSALALWRGPLMADVADDRLRQRIGAGLDDLRRTAVESLAEADLDSGHPQQVVTDLAPLVETHPTWERSIALLMTALYRCGRQADALALYDRTRRLLADELGVDPGPHLRERYDRILRSDPSLDPGPTAATTTTPQQATPLVPRQLPRDVANFTGREADLARLDEESTVDGPVPAIILTTISGTAGVGKTALAVRWAHHAAHRFPDGQLFVDLRGFDIGPPVRPIDALVQLLLALGVEPDRIPAGQDEAAGLYRSLVAQRRMLVVLDNAASAESVRPLLPGGRDCLVLITSRNRLSGLVAHDGARPIPLDALSHKDSVALLARVMGERRFDAEPEATAELAIACGHLPLALRIAAATLVDQPDLRIADYLTRFGRVGLDTLRIEDDERSAVGAAFDQSYAALEPRARRMFRLVSLFPAGWTADAAAAVADCDPDTARRTLVRLAEAHLVAEPSPDRYDLHDLLRVYARERLHAEEGEATRSAMTDRLYRWYTGRVDASARLLYPTVVRVQPPDASHPDFPGRDAALRWHDDERANLIALIVEPSPAGTARLVVVLADALRGFFITRRNPVDWLAVATAAVTASEVDGDPRLRAAAYLQLSSAVVGVGDLEDSISHAERAASLSREAGWVEGELASLNLLGSNYDNAGLPERAETVLTEALRLNRAINRYTGMATNLTNLGRLNLKLGRLAMAAEQLTEMLDLVEQQRLTIPPSFALSNLGETYRLLGRYDEASRRFADAVEAGRRVGNLSGEANALSNLAVMRCDQGRLDEALEHAETATHLIAELGERYTQAAAIGALARVRYRRGDLDAARELFADVLAVGQSSEGVYPLGNARIGLAELARDAGEYGHALNEAREALDLARRARLPLVEADALTVLAGIHLRAGDAGAAREHGERALEIHTRTGNRLGQARTLMILGYADGPAAGRERRQESTKIFADLGIPEVHPVGT